LPAGSIGIGEIAFPFSAAKQIDLLWQGGQPNSVNFEFTTPAGGVIVVQGYGYSRNAGPKEVTIDGTSLGEALGPTPEDPDELWSFSRVVPVTAGQHTMTVLIGPYTGLPIQPSCRGTFVISFVRDVLQ
jgi:hypothetical protein